MFLIFDTETTGLPRNFNAPLSDSDNWPRMVQIAWQLHDAAGNLLSAKSIIVKPEGYTIPFNAEQIHGISTQRALAEGADLKEVLLEFAEVVKQTQYLCGHNIGFDNNIIGAEFLRTQMPNFFEGKGVIDTKNDETTAFCAIPGGKGGKFKWPTLTELYTKLFNKGFEEAHNAAFDVAATAKCFFEIIRRRVIQVKEFSIEQATTIQYQAPDLSELLASEKKLKEAKTQGTTITPAVADLSTPVSILNTKYSHLHNHSQFSVL